MSSSPSLKRPPADPAGGPPKKPNHGAPAPADIQKMLAEARARAAGAKAKLAAAAAKPSGGGGGAASPPAAPAPASAADRLAAMRSRVASAVSRSSATAAAPSASASRPGAMAPLHHRRDEREMEEAASKARGGLDVGLHPALLGDSVEAAGGSRRGGRVAPKFATTMANRREAGGRGAKAKKQLDLSAPSPDLMDPAKNPYFDPALGAKATQPRRISKALVFNPKGKYIEQANALRRQEALEEMKKRIAAAARKAGIDEDMHADKAFAPPEPPAVEWWDQGLLANAESYGDLQPSDVKIHTDDSIVTPYIQHPIQLEPPQDKRIPPPKPLPLTKKEQKKVRRQRRAEDLKDKQAKIRLGLEPPPPPKIKKSNMMRVLGEEAVKDPTAVEARVNREIRERLEGHLATNEARRLTREQRLEKLEGNRAKDLQKGICCLVFRIETLANGRHRFKINKNAEQWALTGLCIMNPKFNLLVVEGGQHAVAKFRHLMLDRIDWTEDAPPLEDAAEPADDDAKDVDMSRNRCTLVWEGELKQKGFRKFSTDRCPTDAMAKERLERANMQHMWTLAKSLVAKEE